MFDKFFTMVLAALVAAFSFGATASAAGAAASDEGSILELAKPVFDAVMSGQGWLAAALALVLTVGAARRYLPAWFPKRMGWIKSDAGSTLSTFLLSLGGAFATAFAAGAAPSMLIAKTALGVAIAAAGGYQALKHLVAPLLRAMRAKLPAFTHPALDLILWIFNRPTRTESAEAAGAAAVAAKPAAGAAGVVGAPANWP